MPIQFECSFHHFICDGHHSHLFSHFFGLKFVRSSNHHNISISITCILFFNNLVADRHLLPYNAIHWSFNCIVHTLHASLTGIFLLQKTFIRPVHLDLAACSLLQSFKPLHLGLPSSHFEDIILDT